MAGYAVFALLSGALLATAVAAVTRRSPVVGIAWLLASFVGIAASLLSVGAEPLALLWIVVYAGAILVLFVFAIAAAGDAPGARRFAPKISSPLLLALLVTVQLALCTLFSRRGEGVVRIAAAGIESLGALGGAVLTTYPGAFEIASVLVVAALAVSLALTRGTR